MPKIVPILQNPENHGSFPVLVVEDDKTASALVCAALRENGIETLEFHSAAEICSVVHDLPRLGAAIIDLGLPDGDGLDVIRQIRHVYPELPFYVLTAKNAVYDAVIAMKAGAADYIVKPFEPQYLVSLLKPTIATYMAAMVNRFDDFSPQARYLQWKSPRMREAINAAKRAAKTLSPVLISGPKHSGKRSIAGLIHQLSRRSGNPLIHLNAEIMHHAEQGIARPDEGNGLISPYRGVLLSKLERAVNATVYLENIDRLDPSAQCALATWLKKATRSAMTRNSTCRLIASATSDLTAAAKAGSFREDLLYLISVYQIMIPSLAERPEDLSDLCEQAVTMICVTRRLRRPCFTRKATELLMDHSWPGNLAELHNVLEYAVTHTNDGLITPDDLPKLATPDASAVSGIPLGSTSIEDLSKASLLAALQACEGNRRRAAQRLKVSLRTVYNMIQRYGLNESLPSGREMMAKRMRKNSRDEA